MCSLIVDRGSCANADSTTLVEKLQLKTKPHPHLYSIQWLNQAKEVQVSSRCVVALSIGKSYQDEIRCDIFPMDACHILLGRPWLFGYRIMHDGYQNTYTLLKNGQKITLAPLAPHQITKPKAKEEPKGGEMLLSLLEPTLLASHCEHKTFKEMILFTPPQEETETPLHPLAKQLLKDYSHVFRKEIPSGLPP